MFSLLSHHFSYGFNHGDSVTDDFHRVPGLHVEEMMAAQHRHHFPFLSARTRKKWRASHGIKGDITLYDIYIYDIKKNMYPGVLIIH